MKILTKEEEQEHYKYAPPFFPLFGPLSPYLTGTNHLQTLIYSHSETLKGGIGGGIVGLGLGALGVYGAAARFPAFRSLTIPLRAFLITSSGTFAGELEFSCCYAVPGLRQDKFNGRESSRPRKQQW